MRRSIILISIAALLFSCKQQEPISAVADRVFKTAVYEFSEMDKSLDPGRYPRSYKYGELITSDTQWWCSGFYPGSLWYVYEYTGNEEIGELAKKYTLGLSHILEGRTDHDLGFQINCSYGNALRITGDSTLYAPMMVDAARKLASRFIPEAGVIKSWDWGKILGWDCPVIIDNMMNLELLMVASGMTGDEALADIANTHATTTMAHHFRDDYTCYHVVDYDSKDGSVRRRQTHQGYADESAWSRGQAWAMYGYTMMYQKTGRKEYLAQAENVAKMILGKLTYGPIPIWDFDDPKGVKAYRDASAGAVMASAFATLSELTPNKNLSRKYRTIAEEQVRELASPSYLTTRDELGGFLLKHSVGNLPGESEVDRPLTYADYYFLEALLKLAK